jgi:hypothetical protein
MLSSYEALSIYREELSIFLPKKLSSILSAKNASDLLKSVSDSLALFIDARDCSSSTGV